MPLTQTQYVEFCALIEPSAAKRERHCGVFLREAASWLALRTPRRIVEIRQEDRTHYGDSDFVIIADIANNRGQTERYAILWEIKAAQCALMDFDDNRNRCRPSIDLIKAENQLIHYHSEVVDNNAFRERHRIISRENIKVGGIIIGRDGRFASDQRNPENERAAERSMEIRQRYFYKPNGIELWTWDAVARYLEPQHTPPP